MTRPGLVLEVDERTPPLLLHHGESFHLEKFPLGTRVIYPPDSLPGSTATNRSAASATPRCKAGRTRARIVMASPSAR